jgi:hypothetical protein
MPINVSRPYRGGGVPCYKRSSQEIHALDQIGGESPFATEEAGDNRVSQPQGKVPSLHTRHGLLKFLDNIGRKG